MQIRKNSLWCFPAYFHGWKKISRYVVFKQIFLKLKIIKCSSCVSIDLTSSFVFHEKRKLVNIIHLFITYLVLLGWCCPLCMVCDSAKRLGESVPMYCCLAYFCPICTIYMLRKNTRQRYGIEVSCQSMAILVVEFLREGYKIKDICIYCG